MKRLWKQKWSILDDERTNDDMEDMKLIKGFKYRSFLVGEGEGGGGLVTSEQNVQECESSTGRFEGNRS